jgi:outer membrane protein assembly factor BamB
VVIVALQLLARFVVPLVAPGSEIVGTIGGLVGGLGIVVWWVLFSRAPGSERLGAVVVIIGAILATRSLMHPSIQNGMMGMMFFIYAVPLTLSVALVGWAVASRRLADGPRRLSMVAAILLGCSVWALVRTEGITGGGRSQLAWRWTKDAEARLLVQAGDALAVAVPKANEAMAPARPPLATEVGERPATHAGGTSAADTPVSSPDERLGVKAGDEPTSLPEAPATPETAAEWPGFRGPDRDDVVRGVRIRTDWAASPPIELWRRKVGPGWSSFAVQGDLLYTQEQRGDDEVVACYNLTTGNPVWMHSDAARFWESNGGAGPRATPALHRGRVYSFGATGVLNALDASDGAVVWSRDVAKDTGVKVPGWGFAGSPLVAGDVVIVAASGALAGYDLGTGDRRWFVPSQGGGYSSPHRLSIDGTSQVLLMGGSGATSFAAKDGAKLWEHSWEGVPIVQPAVVSGGDLLISSADMMGGMGTRRIQVAHGPGGWAVEERWTSRGLKPYFNDFVVHKGHAFGFDGSILSCIDIEDGKRKWKGGRYGNGQMLLLPEQDLLLVLSEDGELALVGATTDQFTEVARFEAIEGKTWNHPALVGDVLLVRNGQEMVAFRLALAAR